MYGFWAVLILGNRRNHCQNRLMIVTMEVTVVIVIVVVVRLITVLLTMPRIHMQ